MMVSNEFVEELPMGKSCCTYDRQDENKLLRQPEERKKETTIKTKCTRKRITAEMRQDY